MTDDLVRCFSTYSVMMAEEGKEVPTPDVKWVKYKDYKDAADRIEELEAKLAKAAAGLKQCQEEIDDYIRQEYPQDNPLHERYRMRDFSANPARIAIAALKETPNDLS